MDEKEKNKKGFLSLKELNIAKLNIFKSNFENMTNSTKDTEYNNKYEKARKRIEEIRRIVQAIKNNKDIPSAELIREAQELADQFPSLSGKAQEINDLRVKAIEEVAKRTGTPTSDLRTFEDLLEKEPLKAISLYIDSRKEDIFTINALINGERLSFEQESKLIENALSQNEQYKLSAVIKRGAVILEEMVQNQETSSERSRLENDLEEGVKLKLHERIVEKHKAKREKEGLPVDHVTISKEDGSSIVHDIHHVGSIINHNIEGGIKRLGTLFIHHEGHKVVDEFIEHKDTNILRVQIEEAEKRNAAVVAEKLAKEKAEREIKEAARSESNALYSQERISKNKLESRKAARQAMQTGRR